MSIPSIGAGTFRLQGQAAFDSVSNALEAGYRAVDTAQIYQNEAEVGRAVAESRVARGEVFLTTKVWNDNFAADRLIASLEESLEKLRTDYVDLKRGKPRPSGRGQERGRRRRPTERAYS